jgi:thiaminase
MHFTCPVRYFCRSTRIALAASSLCLLPSTPAKAYQHIDPKKFSVEESPRILKKLGAHAPLLKVNKLVTDQMSRIIASPMVQGMARGTLTREEWDEKYMRADVLYIYKLGQELAERSKKEQEPDRSNVMEFAEMFMGYGKHFDRLKRYGLSPSDSLVSQECDDHIELLSRRTTMDEFYISILTDMLPYVVFSNYLLQSIEPADQNPWYEYAKKYGDLNNKYAKERLGKTVRIANEILATHKVSEPLAETLFIEGFSFEEWFIRQAFEQGFQISSQPDS